MAGILQALLLLLPLQCLQGAYSGCLLRPVVFHQPSQYEKFPFYKDLPWLKSLSFLHSTEAQTPLQELCGFLWLSLTPKR
jgi:hypothetical protein